MAQKVLILQDLGVDSDQLNQLVKPIGLSYELIFDDQKITDSQSVVGLITIKTTVDASLFDKWPGVKFVAVAFTGYDCVDMVAAKQHDIAVFNVPAYATDSTAELAVGLALVLLRQIPEADQIIRSGGWDMKAGQELTGKTIGIIGTGTIGIRSAQLFSAFGCKLLGWSRSNKQEFLDISGEYQQDMIDVFKKSDIVSVHLPLNDATKGIITSNHLKSMKKSAYLINVARGPIINTQDLVDSLQAQDLAGAAIDVYDQEPILPDNPLLTAPNVVLTPHIAYKTEQALLRRAQITIENIKNFADGCPQNIVS